MQGGIGRGKAQDQNDPIPFHPADSEHAASSTNLTSGLSSLSPRFTAAAAWLATFPNLLSLSFLLHMCLAAM